MLAYQAIRSGDSRVVLCGGVESMTRAEHVGFLREPTSSYGNVSFNDTIFKDVLECSLTNGTHMGLTGRHF
jgi:acetyl-CoA C-acetyltransferase